MSVLEQIMVMYARLHSVHQDCSHKAGLLQDQTHVLKMKRCVASIMLSALPSD